MKITKLITMAMVFFLSFLSGCMIVDSDFDDNDDDYDANRVYGSGRIITVIKDYHDFNKIILNSGFYVKVVKGSNYSVIIECDDNIVDFVRTYQSGSKLSISMASGHSYKNVTLNVVIETPDLESIIANGGVIIDFKGYDSYDDLSLELNGGSTIKGYLDIGTLNLNLNGGSIVNLSGTGDNLKVFGNGGAIFRLYEFPVENCNLTFNGGCLAYMNVTGVLNAVLSGGSILKYKGNPTIGSISISGGSIIQRDN